MWQNRKTDFLVIMILIFVVVAFAFSYNSTVTEMVADAAYNDKETLQLYNNEIIGKLISEQAVDNWSQVVEQYQDIVIVIEDSSNNVVAKSIGRTWTALDVKVQTPFEYGGEAYVITSSVYLLRDYVSDIRIMVEFVFMEFIIGISALCIFILIIYKIILRPYKLIYKAVEEYDTTGEFVELKLKGYASKVYARLITTAENLELQQNNQRRIIASISHDIKTPLTSIMGYTERLKKSGISEERKERYLDIVYGKSVEIGQLIDEFDEYLSYNMLKEIKADIVDCSEIKSYVIENYADELEGEGVSFYVTNDAGDTSVMIDLQKFKRVFGNIFANSLKHFRSGEERRIEFTMQSEKDIIHFIIKDNGDGVDEDKLAVIFEPLYTSDKGRKVAGLGLAVCREIVDRHSGKIYAENAEGNGLIIHIELPKVKKLSVKGERHANSQERQD